MRRLKLLFVVLIAFSAGGCSTSNDNAPRIETPPSPFPTVLNIPVFTAWQIGDNPIGSSGDFSFAAHALVLTGEQTMILYSLSRLSLRTSLAGSWIRMVDEAKQDYPLSIMTPLAELDRLQVGVITFAPRRAGIRELHLLLQPSAQAAPLDILVARLLNPPEDSSRIAFARSSTSRDGYLEQTGYRISFNGWSLYKGDEVADQQSAKGMTTQQVLEQNATEAASRPASAGATPTIVPPNPSAQQLSGGRSVMDEATLRIEDLQSHLARFVYVVFLDNGDVKAIVLQ